MPDAHCWKPSKAELSGTTWRASRDPRQVSVRSRLVADLLIDAYEKALREHASGVLVDLGCGQAPYFGIYRDLVKKSVGVDWPNSIHPSIHADVQCDLNLGIELPDAFADTVLCTDVLEHIFEPARLWKEIARVTKHNGTLILGAPFLYWIHEQPFDYHRYTQYALERYANDAGFSIERLSPVGGLPHVIGDLVCKGAPACVSTRLVHAICQFLLRAARVRSDAPTKFPLAYLLVAKRRATSP